MVFKLFYENRSQKSVFVADLVDRLNRYWNVYFVREWFSNKDVNNILYIYIFLEDVDNEW